MTSAHVATWTGPEIVEECGEAYKAYNAARTTSYEGYFASRSQLKDVDHAYKAADLEAALPEGWRHLEHLMPKAERHLHHLSGKSSQVLALGLLGVAATRDPSLSWVWEALGPLPPPLTQRPAAQFEQAPQPEVLGEQPRQTSIDFFVSDPAALLCIEAKWTEAGMGSCGCGKGSPAVSACSDKVLARDAYWKTAKEVFQLPDRQEGRPCRLSFTYQAVRNAAAALRLARAGQTPVFGLLYDAENPYFKPTGRWPGWPDALRATLDGAHPDLRFAAVSWQELLPMLPLDAATLEWASSKHGLSA